MWTILFGVSDLSLNVDGLVLFLDGPKLSALIPNSPAISVVHARSMD